MPASKCSGRHAKAQDLAAELTPIVVTAIVACLSEPSLAKKVRGVMSSLRELGVALVRL